MPLAVRVSHTNGQAIRGPARPTGFERVIAEINQNSVGDVFGQLKSHIVTDKDGWRIDRQSPTAAGQANVQVQRNGATPDGEKSSVACVLVDARYNVGRPGGNDPKLTLEHNARMSELAKAVRAGLLQSAQSWAAAPTGSKIGRMSVFEVWGDFSA